MHRKYECTKEIFATETIVAPIEQNNSSFDLQAGTFFDGNDETKVNRFSYNVESIVASCNFASHLPKVSTCR